MTNFEMIIEKYGMLEETLDEIKENTNFDYVIKVYDSENKKDCIIAGFRDNRREFGAAANTISEMNGEFEVFAWIEKIDR